MFSARYERAQQDASAQLSSGPVSVVVELSDSDDAPPTPARRAIGFVMPDCEQHEPQRWEGDDT